MDQASRIMKIVKANRWQGSFFLAGKMCITCILEAFISILIIKENVHRKEELE
jgi:hypothetical protein